MTHPVPPLLNLDAGELLDETEDLWSLFDLLNIACGGHAGDAASMARVVAFCAAHAGTRPGAHPSYPDRDGFGRRALHTPAAALAASIAGQCAALDAIARAAGLTVEHIKPHGALYHDVAAAAPLAAALLDGAARALGRPFTVVGPPRGALLEVAAARGLPYLREGFADRARRPDGSLVPRGEPGALITDPAAAAAQALALAASGDIDTLCVHADTPGSLSIARAVRAALPRPPSPASAA
jgi:5-oxoprolinase (ATP-hydrolysing) subunit A